MRTRAALSIVAVLVMVAVSGCSGSDSRAAETMEGTSRLEAALAVVADDEMARSRFAFADVTRIRDLYRADNKENLISVLGQVVAGAEFASGQSPSTSALGLDLAGADYVLSVGDPATGHSALIGGQDSQTVADAARSAGWVEQDGEWVVVSYENAVKASEDTAVTHRFAERLPRIVAKGHTASVSRTLTDSVLPGISFDGPSLADNERAAALADCLGDVVAASIRTEVQTESGALLAVAAGVSVPKDSSDLTAHHVVCTMWADDASAKAYESATAVDVEERWAKIATSEPVLERLDGPVSTVRWEIDGRTRSAVMGIESLDLDKGMLPGLPACSEEDAPADRYPYGCLPAVPVIDQTES